MAVGPDKIAEVARRFGLGEIFDIGIPGQKKGLVGSREWKKTAFKRDPVWHPGDSVPFHTGSSIRQISSRPAPSAMSSARRRSVATNSRASRPLFDSAQMVSRSSSKHRRTVS